MMHPVLLVRLQNLQPSPFLGEPTLESCLLHPVYISQADGAEVVLGLESADAIPAYASLPAAHGADEAGGAVVV